MKKRALIFSGGRIGDYSLIPIKPHRDDYIICADSGIEHCLSLGICVNLWVGDFDSADFSQYSKCDILSHAEIVRLNPIKDDTDTEHALDCAVEKGCDEIVLIGGTGDRFDHSLANIFVAEKYIDRGIRLKLVDEKNIIHLVKKGEIELSQNDFTYVSILPLEDSVVSCNGFAYGLDREVMHRNSSRGISNELTDEKGKITVHDGCVLVVESRD